MKPIFFGIALLFLVASPQLSCQEADSSVYSYREGNPYGSGKWFMGREIAHVMGFHGMDWLERPEREEEENTSRLIKNLDLEEDDVVADIGAGSGYHVFKMAPLVPQGKVMAVDIQEEMLTVMKRKKREMGIENVEIIKGGEKTVNLPSGSVDKILLVDVYHEFAYPMEMMRSIREALKPNGKVYLIEYRKEDEWVPIKEVHKMTEAQAIKEWKYAGFEFEKNMGNLPWQHCLVFTLDHQE